MDKLDPHCRLLIAVINIGGDFKFASDAGKLLDHRPRPCAINLDLHRSLSLMGFTFYDHEVPLGQSPKHYQQLHEQLRLHLMKARGNFNIYLLFFILAKAGLPFVARIDSMERAKFSEIILDNMSLPLWEDEEQ